MCDKFFTLYYIVIVCVHKTYGQDFGYDGMKGPTHWGEQYNSCKGKHQSPINIDSLDVKPIAMKPLEMTGFEIPPIKTTLQNNGHTVMVTMDSAEQPTITGGPLHGIYEFSQLHFHWGDNDTFGSEDKIDDQSFPMELHIVFFKKNYRNSRSALNYNDGLTVLAIFFEIVQEENESYSEFTQLLANVTQPSHTAAFERPPALKELMPTDLLRYYTYNGSLTTPPCSEVVTWIDFKQAVPLSHEQIDRFREIKNNEGEALTHNFRPIQPLGDRIVLFNLPEEEVEPFIKKRKDRINGIGSIPDEDMYGIPSNNLEDGKGAGSQISIRSFIILSLFTLNHNYFRLYFN